jgi:predicted negative regulator of RcsB-dependent stress response
VDRQTRKDLKTDKFAQEVTHTWEFLSLHRAEVQRYGIIAVIVIVLAGGWYFYSRYQAGAREEALAQALRVDDATVGPQAQPPLMNFPTAEDKEKAVQKAFADLAAKYPGTQEGAIAQMNLAGAAADKGDLATAEKMYKGVVDSAPEAYASVATVALADIYAAQGKYDEAEKLLRKLMDNPTPFVSKEEATLHLAEVLADTKPAEARKLLEPLRTARSSVSRAAIAALSKIPQNN